MKAIRASLLSLLMVASFPAVAQKHPQAAKQAASILIHLDLNSFPNSTGPRRRSASHTPADYGFAEIENFPDGWAQVSEPDESWHMAVSMLQRGRTTAIICFTDSAGNRGTYHSTQVLKVRADAHARWAATQLPDRPDCKNAPAVPLIAGDAARPAPAEILQHLDDFRGSLSPPDRHRLDQVLRRSPNGGIAQCDGAEGSRASCEAAAYMPALHSTGLMLRFLSSPGPVASAAALRRHIDDEGATATANSLSSSGWNVALDYAAGGRADWIDVVASMRQATDGARSETIDKALSDALLTNPSAVLRLLATSSALPGVAWLCQDRSIEPSAPETRDHINAMTAAVRNVADPTLRALRNRCLAHLARR